MKLVHGITCISFLLVGNALSSTEEVDRAQTALFNSMPVFADQLSVSSSFVSPFVTGNYVGDVTGNVTGNMVGNITGNVTGNVSGNVIGNVDATTITTQSLNVQQKLVLSGIYRATLDADQATINLDTNVSIIILTKTYTGLCRVTINLWQAPIDGQLIYVLTLSSGAGSGNIILQSGGANFTLPAASTIAIPAGVFYIFVQEGMWIPLM